MGKLFGHRWYVVSILLAISMMGYVDRFVLSFLIDPIKHSLSLSDTQVGLVGGAAFPCSMSWPDCPWGASSTRETEDAS